MLFIEVADQATRRNLVAVDLQGDLIGLLEELLRDAEHRELVVRRLSLGQAGLHDVDTNRDSAGSAEVPHLNQALLSADLEAGGPAALGSQCFPFEQVGEQVGPPILVVQPNDASLAECGHKRASPRI